MRILVAGGAGYIGSIVARNLLKAGHSPVVIDNLSTGKRQSLDESVPFYAGDIGNQDFLDSLFRKEPVEMVMHFAAMISVGESMGSPDRYYANNLIKMVALLDGMRRHGVNKFIFSSTAAVYGEPEYLPMDERHRLAPINPYGRSKWMAEMVLDDYCRAFGMDCMVLRYFNAAGASLDGMAGESQKVKQNLIPIALEHLELGRITTIYGDDWGTPDGTCVRDYVHVEDIAAAHLSAVGYLRDMHGMEIVNLGSGMGLSVREVLTCISHIGGRELVSRIGPRRAGDSANLVASNKKAKALLGWEPVNSTLDTIIRSAYQWHFHRKY